jgi:hypothetical protein
MNRSARIFAMDDDEPILLHEPDLMLAILKVARRRAARLDDALGELESNLKAAGEPDPADPEDLRRRLREAARFLQAAAAIAPEGTECYRLTERGLRLITEHPEGVDASVLRDYPEFRAFIRARSRGQPDDDPHLPAYVAGMDAFRTGQPSDANPFADDSSDHLAWENGWTEGRDSRRRA